MNYLIIDLNIRMDGHRFGFMNNLLQYAGKNLGDHQFLFLTNNSKEFELKSGFNHIKVLQIKQAEQDKLNATECLIAQAKQEWILIDKYAKENRAERVVLMYLDTYLLELGKASNAYKISGIWFAPYPRLQAETHTFKERIKVLLTKARKKYTMQWALRNPNLDKVFILNDEEMPSWLNKGSKKRFYTLPDPYFTYPLVENFDLKEKYSIPQDNLVFLQFGYIDERKNMENILHAFNALPKNLGQKSTLLIIGKFKPGFKTVLEDLKDKDAKFQMVLRDEFISDAEMESTFSQSDVILRMNIGFFGSSGIIGVAASHNKPVIASKTGVMAELVEKYALGQLVNPLDVKEITEKIEGFFENKNWLNIDGESYRESHNLEAFARTLLLS